MNHDNVNWKDHAESLDQIRKDILFLERLQKECDPASAISIGLRRGVPQDNSDVEDDDTRRPWRTMSFSGGNDGDGTVGMKALIDVVIADRRQTLKMGIVYAEAESKKLTAAIEAAKKSFK